MFGTMFHSTGQRVCILDPKNPMGIRPQIMYPDLILPARLYFARTIMSARHSWIAALLVAAPAFAAEPVDYVRDVKPILAANCIICHGPTKQKGDLRLDLYARIKLGGNSGPVVIPKKAAASEMIRRLSPGRLGLPRRPAGVELFLKDTSPTAYESLVERLLNTPHYGEHLARLWLDAARYADSNGFTIDAPRSIWKYRDWVINAFNNDLPFDQFTIQQLAGDLLPKPSTDQLVATGFHRNTMINQEGGIDLEQFRVESVVDRVNTTGSVWLGLTIGCCQCHDHKFDPISQREYYQFFAFLNNCDEPNLEILSPADEVRRKQVQEALAA